MTELSLTILDVASNSKTAGASQIDISVLTDTQKDLMEIIIKDNGRGMSEEQIKNVVDPFYTTRTTRRVGMGIPLFKMLCEQCEGSLQITGGKGVGVTVNASFKLSSVDRPPLGDLGSSITTLILDSIGTEYTFTYAKDGQKYVFDTKELKQVLGETEIDSSLMAYIQEMINDNIKNINGGVNL